MARRDLPIPPHFDPEGVGAVWQVPYEERARDAAQWARQHSIAPAARDRFRICLILVDVQNTFCIPGFELYVGGRSGTGAVDDNGRLCAFIYRNIAAITQICPTMDTHQAMQIFHAVSLVNDRGDHPAPFTVVTGEVGTGKTTLSADPQWRMACASMRRTGSGTSSTIRGRSRRRENTT